MDKLPTLVTWQACLLAVCLGVMGCSGPRDGEEAPNRRARPAQQQAGTDVQLDLLAAADQVQTIQLYADDEEQLPIVPLQGNQQLTLEFDLMEPSGRPLSVYFYHADRTWKRDLFASEYLDSFERDDLFDYTASRGTQVSYTHYTYRFPNRNIRFRISGNYILRVTEQGREDQVLFERAFFVTEDAAALNLGIGNVMAGGGGYPLAQPVLTFTPPQHLAGNVFDYNVCFIRNGRFEAARCSDRPSLTRQPDLLFELQPERSFEPPAGEYVLDLSTLRVGGQVEQSDLSVVPYRVVLEPDYARFTASGLDPLLNGQAVVEAVVRDVAEPDIEGEYAEVRFRFVPPDEQRLGGGVYVVGSFNGWAVDLGRELRWVSEQGRYEGTLLVKQGQYEYRYTSPERRVRRQLSTRLPRAENIYSAFVYFSDTSLNTDRLLAAQSVRAQ